MILAIRSISFLFDFYLFKLVLLLCSIDDFIFPLLEAENPFRIFTTGILWTIFLRTLALTLISNGKTMPGYELPLKTTRKR